MNEKLENRQKRNKNCSVDKQGTKTKTTSGKSRESKKCTKKRKHKKDTAMTI